MIQTVLKYMLCLFTAICCCGCRPYEKITRILFASDLHYLSDELYDDGEAFLSVVTNADGKYMPYSQLPGNELPGLKRMIQGSFASTYPDTAIPTVTMLLFFSAS